ncbi:MAG: tRNA preQ1(34) S-adenosylmethionine ribosyltransferase-isomerase QueA [Syntrophobacteraceae bacterium]
MVVDDEAAFRLADYDFELPSELIAQKPAARRESSRLLVLNRQTNKIEHSRFDRIGDFLNRGDLLVVNDTRVVRARLFGRKESGGKVEFLVLDPYKSPERGANEGYLCLVKASKGIRAGQSICLDERCNAEVLVALPDGKAVVRFHGDSTLLEVLDRVGEVPLPPYITREAGRATSDDLSCYQTTYARCPGAVAAPTAGLHFSAPLLDSLRAAGVETASVTLHVGYGTFAPIRCDDIREHRMHSEYFSVDAEAADAVCRAKQNGRRVIAVGTTVVRTLEWCLARAGSLCAFSGACNHYIYPGYNFGAVDCMVTNFHLPRSSLILLVSAFAGRRRVLCAYEEAVRERYRFFSYGDAMLIV